MSRLPTITRKSFNSKFTAKIDFPIGYFMIGLAYHCISDADIGILMSLHTLLYYLDHMLVKFEQNLMVRTGGGVGAAGDGTHIGKVYGDVPRSRPFFQASHHSLAYQFHGRVQDLLLRGAE